MFVHGHFAGAVVEQGDQTGVQFDEFIKAEPTTIARALALLAAHGMKCLTQLGQLRPQLPLGRL
ncbi:hypothetical protein D3C77_658150 [compost metagenome]